MADNPLYANPFLMVDTPESNYMRREADITKRYDPQGFWVGEAARAGSKLRKELNARGIAMGRDDERALNNKGILEGARCTFSRPSSPGS